MDKVLVFDIWGDYAHFRKIETTTSPLTYSFPTRTALSGLIAAMIGLKKDSYYSIFDMQNAWLAVGITSPIKKTRININLIKTDDGFYLWDINGTPRSPTPFEFIKDPHYRIYCWLKDFNHYSVLKKFLENHMCIYTPYFGISELIADFKFIGEESVSYLDVNGKVDINSVIRKDKAKVEVEIGKRYAVENIPLVMDENRRVLKYEQVLFETTGKSMRINSGQFYKIGNDNVLPM